MAKYFRALNRDLVVALNFIILAGLSLCAHFPTGSGDTFTSKDSQTGILLQIVETAMEKSQHKNTLRFFSATWCLIFLCRVERDYGNAMLKFLIMCSWEDKSLQQCGFFNLFWAYDESSLILDPNPSPITSKRQPFWSSSPKTECANQYL